jgi:hypothetical protein
VNNEILKLIAEADFSSAIQEVDKFRKKMDTITTDLGKKMSMGDVGNLSRLYDDFDKLIQKKKEFAKAEKRGTFREQEKATKRLRAAIGKVDEDFQEFSRSAKAGGKTVAEPLLHDLDVLKQDFTELRSKGLGKAIGARAEQSVERIKQDLRTLPEDTKEWRAQIMESYTEYKKVKQEQDEIIATLQKYEAQEEKITSEAKINYGYRQRIANMADEEATVIANRIVPAHMKQNAVVQDIQSRYEKINNEYDEMIAEQKQRLKQLVQEGAAQAHIKRQTQKVLKLQKQKQHRAQMVSQEMNEQVRSVKQISGMGAFKRTLLNIRNLVTGLRNTGKAANKAADGMSKLGIQQKEYNKSVIRQGGRTAGLIRTFSRWRNRILVTTFALAGLVRGMKQMINMAVEARKQFIALNKVASNLGIASTRVTKAAKQLAEDGLVSLREGTQAIKALIATGADVDLVVQNLRAMKDAAIANGRAGYTVGQNLVAYARGVKQMRSQLADAAGVMKNISQILKEHPDWVERYGKATALLKGFTHEAQRFQGSVEEMLKTLPGKIQQLTGQMRLFKTEIGSAIATFSTQWTEHFLQKIEKSREMFANQEGAVYQWFNTLGSKVVEVVEEFEKMLPIALEIVKSVLTIGDAILWATRTIVDFLNNFGKFGGKLVSFLVQFKIFKTILFSVVHGFTKFADALAKVSLTGLSGRMATLGLKMSYFGETLQGIAKWLPVVGTLIAALLPLIVGLFKKGKENAAEMRRQLQNNREAWEKLGGEIGSVYKTMKKYASERFDTSNVFGMGEGIAEFEENLKSHLKMQNEVKSINEELAKLQEERNRKQKQSARGTALDVLSHTKVKSLNQEINALKERQTVLNERLEASSREVQKVAERFAKDFELQTIFQENGKSMVEFTRQIKAGNEVIEKTYEWTWKEFMVWTKINNELSNALSGVKQLQESTKQAARDAESDLIDIRREIRAIGETDYYEDIMGEFNEYKDMVSKAQQEIDALTRREEQVQKQFKEGTSTFIQYMKQAYEMSETTGEIKYVPSFEWEEAFKTMDVSKQKFITMIDDMIDKVKEGTEITEKEYEEVSELASEANITFYNEDDLERYMNLMKERKALRESIASAREKFSKKEQAGLELLKNKYLNMANVRNQEYKEEHAQRTTEIENREKNLDLLDKQIAKLKVRGSMITADPLAQMDMEGQIQKQETLIEQMKLRRRFNDQIVKSRQQYEKLIAQSQKKLDGVKAAEKWIKEHLDEGTKEREVILSQLAGIKETTKENVEGWRNQKKEAKEALEDEYQREKKILEINQKQALLEKQLRNARKVGELSFWKDYFDYKERQERYRERDLQWWDKVKARADDFFNRVVMGMQEMDTPGFGFLSGAFQSMGFGAIDIEEMEQKAERIEWMLQAGIWGDQKQRVQREKLKNMRDAIRKHWQSVEQIYYQGTQKVLSMMTDYFRKQASLRQERVKEQAKYQAKLEVYREHNVISRGRMEEKLEDYEKYREDQAKLHRLQMKKYRKQLAADAMISAGTQVASQAIAKLAMTLPAPLGLAIGAGLIAAGGALATGPNYGKKVAAMSSKISARKEVGAYGTAFENIQAAGGGTASTGTETAGGTVSAPPQNININPNIEFNGETIFLTPQGEADASEIGENLGNSIVNVVQDAIDTGEINFTG